jgi:hypothetical protein
MEFETLGKQCWPYLRNIDSNTVKDLLYKCFKHNLPIFFKGKIWLNIGICQTLGFSILKMSLLNSGGSNYMLILHTFLCQCPFNRNFIPCPMPPTKSVGDRYLEKACGRPQITKKPVCSTMRSDSVA